MIIAPYWADTDIRSGQGGEVWHRLTNETDLLARASREVRAAFVTHMDFKPTWLLIATWDHVVYYQRFAGFPATDPDLNTVSKSNGLVNIIASPTHQYSLHLSKS